LAFAGAAGGVQFLAKMRNRGFKFGQTPLERRDNDFKSLTVGTFGWSHTEKLSA
jgi:hypothetical protein